MDRKGGMPLQQQGYISTDYKDLITEEMLIDLSTLQRPDVVAHIADEKQRVKTVHSILSNMIKARK